MKNEIENKNNNPFVIELLTKLTNSMIEVEKLNKSISDLTDLHIDRLKGFESEKEKLISDKECFRLNYVDKCEELKKSQELFSDSEETYKEMYKDWEITAKKNISNERVIKDLNERIDTQEMLLVDIKKQKKKGK
jgi:hypothetical protein